MHCNTLQRTATSTISCNAKLWANSNDCKTTTHCNALQCTAMHCNALQRPPSVATQCCELIVTTAIKLVHTATPCKTLQDTAIRCNTAELTVTSARQRRKALKLYLKETFPSNFKHSTYDRFVLHSNYGRFVFLHPSTHHPSTHHPPSPPSPCCVILTC